MRHVHVAACCLAVLAGCGSEDNGASGLSREALVDRTETACATFARTLAKLPEEHGKGAEVGAVTKRGGEAALRELGGATAAADMAGEFERFRGRLREAVRRATRLEQFARAGNEGPTYAMQTDVETARSEASEIGVRMGADACEDIAPAEGHH